MPQLSKSDIAKELASFVDGTTSAVLQNPLKSISAYTGGIVCAFAIGFTHGYTEEYRKTVGPRICKVKARDQERMKNYKAHAISMKENTTWNADSMRSRVPAQAVEDTAIEAFDYCSLPPEIRNLIVWHLLHEGDVLLPQIQEVMDVSQDFSYKDARDILATTRLCNYFNSIWHHYSYYSGWNQEFIETVPSERVKDRASVLGLLATSRKMYEESHCIYWSSNKFHLARGTFRHSELFFDTISPAHIALIKDIVINLTIADLTPGVINYLEQEARDWDRGQLPRNHDHQTWQTIAVNIVLSIRRDKFRWVSKNLSHLPNIHITYFSTSEGLQTKKFTGLEVAKAVKALDKGLESLELANYIQSARDEAHFVIGPMVASVGWENFKEYLAGKCEHGGSCPLHSIQAV